MSSKQRDEIRNLNRTMDAYRHENDALAERLHRALTERDDLRARLAELESADPAEPRPFRVGDRVRVTEGATKKGLFDGQPMKSLVQGMSGEVVRIHTDGDLYVYTDGPCGYVSPEFCTLIEPELEPDDDAPTPQPVTLTLPDGTTVTFDAVVTR